MHNQEAAVQRTFHLERTSFFYHSALKARTRCSTSCLHTAALNANPDFCPPEVKPCPMKTIYWNNDNVLGLIVLTFDL